MKPHQERVVTEKRELDDKIRKLLAFIDSDHYEAVVDASERTRLEAQLAAMLTYGEVLGERIAAFKETT